MSGRKDNEITMKYDKYGEELICIHIIRRESSRDPQYFMVWVEEERSSKNWPIKWERMCHLGKPKEESVLKRKKN